MVVRGAAGESIGPLDCWVSRLGVAKGGLRPRTAASYRFGLAARREPMGRWRDLGAPVLHVEALDAGHVAKIRRNQDSLVSEGVRRDRDVEVFERGASSLE